MEAMTTDTANADIRAVFFDIDGTLTSFTTHTVPDSTIEAIHRLQAAGVKVLICTGRAPSQMHVVLDTMPVTWWRSMGSIVLMTPASLPRRPWILLILR